MSVLKRVSAFLLATAMVVSTMQVQTEVQAATSAKTVKKAYLSYLEKKIANCRYDEDINYNLFDFNKDGVKELVVSSAGGARSICDIYTYKNKKVVSFSYRSE